MGELACFVASPFAVSTGSRHASSCHRRHPGFRAARRLLEIPLVCDPRRTMPTPSPPPAACRSRCRTTRRWRRTISTASTRWWSPAARSTCDPALYGEADTARDGDAEGGPHRGRTGADPRRAGARHAGARHLRRRAAAGGGARRHADPAHPRRRSRTRWSTSSPIRATSPATPSACAPARCCTASSAPTEMQVNSRASPGGARSRPARGGQRARAGRRDRGRRGRALPLLPRRAVASGVLHRSRRPPHLRRADRRLPP